MCCKVPRCAIDMGGAPSQACLHLYQLYKAMSCHNISSETPKMASNAEMLCLGTSL